MFATQEERRDGMPDPRLSGLALSLILSCEPGGRGRSERGGGGAL